MKNINQYIYIYQTAKGGLQAGKSSFYDLFKERRSSRLVGGVSYE